MRGQALTVPVLSSRCLVRVTCSERAYCTLLAAHYLLAHRMLGHVYGVHVLIPCELHACMVHTKPMGPFWWHAGCGLDEGCCTPVLFYARPCRMSSTCPGHGWLMRVHG